MFMSPSMLKPGGITDRIADITKTGKATLVKDPKSGKVALVIPKVSDTSYNLDCTFHGYESGVLLYKRIFRIKKNRRKFSKYFLFLHDQLISLSNIYIWI